MHHTGIHESKPAEFSIPVRNRYFYGKLLDVFHFELETDYMNAKRWLLNRAVTGWGVVCGLDVQLAEEGHGVVVTPGVALDPWGREITVTTSSRPVPLPDEAWEEQPEPADVEQQSRALNYPVPEQRGGPKGAYHEEEEHDYHIVLCYNECQTGPTPVLAGDCGDETQCAAGTIEERYRLEIRPGKIDPVEIWDCTIPDAITRGKFQYEVLVRWITENCPVLPDDPCIPLANLHLRRRDDGPYCEPDDIDINIRQLALSNRALFYLLLSMLFEVMPRPRGR